MKEFVCHLICVSDSKKTKLINLISIHNDFSIIDLDNVNLIAKQLVATISTRISKNINEKNKINLWKKIFLSKLNEMIIAPSNKNKKIIVIGLSSYYKHYKTYIGMNTKNKFMLFEINNN